MEEKEELISKIRLNKQNYMDRKNSLKKRMTSLILTLSIIISSMTLYSALFKKNTKYDLYTIRETVYNIDENLERRYIRYSKEVENGVYAVYNGEEYKLYDFKPRELRTIDIKEIESILENIYNLKDIDFNVLIKYETTKVQEKIDYIKSIEYLSVYFFIFIGIFLYERNNYQSNGTLTYEEIINLLIEKYCFKKEYKDDFEKLLQMINIKDYAEVFANNKDLFDISSSGLVLKLK